MKKLYSLIKKFNFYLICFLLLNASLSFSHENHYPPKCLTFDKNIQREILINHFLHHPNIDQKSKLEKIQQIKEDDLILRFELAHSFLSPKGLFRIHYDLIGEDAVDPTDANNNGIPDYIDSVAYYFEKAYEVEVLQIGYLPPPKDFGEGGGDEYDIYILELGKNRGGYGYTTADREIFPRFKFPRYTSYIVIDNNYSPKDSSIYSDNVKRRSYYTTGIDALKITAAHELHHAIQYAYGFIEPSIPSIYELTSSWMEYRLYPEIKDYYQYLPQLFNGLKRYPFSNTDPDNGYRWSIYGQYMFKQFGDFAMKKMWELISDGYDPYTALDIAYKEKNTNFIEQWCNFKKWMYFTGTRAIEGKYFDDAKDFPEIKFYSENTYLPPTIQDTGSLYPFEIRAFRTFFKGLGEKSADTCDLIISNIDFESMKKQNKKTSAYEIKFSNIQSNNALFLEPIDYYLSFKSESSNYCSITQDLYLYPGISTCIVENPYPNPLKYPTETAIYLPVPSKILLYERVELAIFNNLMENIYSNLHDVIFDNGCRVIRFDKLEKLNSGLYIYNIKHSKADYWGKFIIKK